MSITIIPTWSSEYITKKLPVSKDVSIVLPSLNKDNKRFFPDGETYVKIPEANSLTGRVVVIHSGIPDPNTGLVELEAILCLLRENKRISVEVFFTYFPYCMQDEVFFPGEVNMAEGLIKKLVDYYLVKKVYIIDPHFAGKSWIGKYPLVFVSAVKLLMDQASAQYLDVIFVAPDIGSQRRTRLIGVSKKRVNSFIVETVHDENFAKSIKGKIVGVVDDIVETGGTLDHFYDKCISYGAVEVVTLITHGVLLSGIQRIQKKYSKLFLTNTIDRVEANIDITDLILEALQTTIKKTF
jgi:phosphoribosylpyrophosphate synthetase